MLVPEHSLEQKLFQAYLTSSYEFGFLISLLVDVCGVVATAPINHKMQSSITSPGGKEGKNKLYDRGGATRRHS